MAISFNIKEVPGESNEWNKNLKTLNMSGLSFNQMYKQSGAPESGVSYKDWLSSEENLYNLKVESGKIQGQMPFNSWMTLRWQGKLNAIGDKIKSSGILEGLKNVGKDVLNKTVLDKGGKAGGAASEAMYVAPEKRILGMKPVIFWTVTTVVVLAGAFVTVKVIKKMRK